MVEIDLSLLDRDAVADEADFAKKVLFDSNRDWVGCQLYREEINKARRLLQERVKQFVKGRRAEIERKNLEIQRQKLAEEAELRRKKEILQRRDQLRETYGHLLNQLRVMVLEGGAGEREKQLEEGVVEQQSILDRLNCNQWPGFLNIPQKGDWMFEVHRSIWQPYIFETFVCLQPGSSIDANTIKREVVSRFGLLRWAKELNNLKYQYKVQGRARGAWYGSKGVWFFTDSENRQIPSPFLLVMNYLKALAKEGFLVSAGQNDSAFIVRFNSIASLESFKAEEAEKERQAALEHERWVEAELEAHRQKEKVRLEKARENGLRRTAYLIERIQMFNEKGIDELKRCNLCSHFQEEKEGATCTECGCDKLWGVQLTPSYLDSLPNRLRSLRLFP